MWVVVPQAARARLQLPTARSGQSAFSATSSTSLVGGHLAVKAAVAVWERGQVGGAGRGFISLERVWASGSPRPFIPFPSL